MIPWESLRAAFWFLLAAIAAEGARGAAHRQLETKLDVKFVAGTDTDAPLDLIPPELAESIEEIAPLFSVSEDKLARLGADRLRRWYRITLEPETDVEQFMKDLEELEVIETVERAPEAKPPPESSETEALLVEFRSEPEVRGPLSLLPAELARSVLTVEPVSERRYRIELKPGTDLKRFLEELQSLDSVVSAARAPRGPPPP